jgi:hypothetical protein
MQLLHHCIFKNADLKWWQSPPCEPFGRLECKKDVQSKYFSIYNI